MADDGAGEKTEEPTPEKLRKLREEGNVPKSQDVTAAISLLACFCVLVALLPLASTQLRDHLMLALKLTEGNNDDGARMVGTMLFHGLQTMALVSAPVLVTAMLTGLALNLAQVGFLFSTKPITPDLNKLNPINGFKQLFSGKKVVELIKTMIKFTVISWLSWIALRDSMRDVALLVRGDLPMALHVVGAIIWDFVTKISVVFIIIAAADLLYQRKRFTKDNMMSKYDVKQEYKQSEGDPHMKGERRRVHQEILSSAGPAAVKNADVVVRNPDHIAVALKYDKEKGTAPTIVAKGTRLWAEKILKAAEDYGIPVVRNVPLAQALNKMDVGDEIPEELYEAVAEVLNFVLTLAEEQKKKQGKSGT